MTTYLGKSCSFCLPRVPFVNCRQFMYLVISLLVLRAGYGIWLYQFLIIAYLFILDHLIFTRSKSSCTVMNRRSNCLPASNSLNELGKMLDFLAIKDVRWLQFWFFNFRFLSCWIILKQLQVFSYFFHIWIHIDGILQPSHKIYQSMKLHFFTPFFAAFAKILVVSKI